jgi:hypothetical protein
MTLIQHAAVATAATGYCTHIIRDALLLLLSQPASSKPTNVLVCLVKLLLQAQQDAVHALLQPQRGHQLLGQLKGPMAAAAAAATIVVC